MNFYNYHEGETLSQALNRIHAEMFEKEQKEREAKELEERLYNRLLQQLMNELNIEVRNEASPTIKQIKKDIDNMFK